MAPAVKPMPTTGDRVAPRRPSRNTPTSTLVGVAAAAAAVQNNHPRRPIVHGRRRLGDDVRLAMPHGFPLELPGRGTTYVHDIPGPKPNSPVLILLHGWTVDARLNWETSVADLAKHFHVITIDHRGHGRGIRSARRFSIEDCADDVVAMANELNIEKFMLAGFSMGGPIAMRCAERHPDRVTGLVLASTCDHFVSGPFEGAAAAATVAFGRLAAWISPKQAHQLMYKVAANVFIYSRGFNPDEAHVELSRNDTEVLIEAGYALSRFDIRRSLNELHIPATIIGSMRDRLIPIARQHEFRDRVRAANSQSVHYLEIDAGHSSPITDPDMFSHAVLEASLLVLGDITHDRRIAEAVRKLQNKNEIAGIEREGMAIGLSLD